MLIVKTNQYDIFKFRSDNRKSIDQTHVKKLANSIKLRNLLELRPIVVNEHMEVIDGQHRLLAAKSLGVDIYYQQEEGLNSDEIILMNIAKSWTSEDYLNYYCKNGYVEYQKLEAFMKKHNISLKVAINICLGQSQYNFREYKEGKFRFKDQDLDNELDTCWETINFIKKMNGYCAYTHSSRFWKALIKLVTHHNFNKEKWMTNLMKMVERITAKANTNDYCKMLMEIYNWRATEKVNLLEEFE